MQRSLTILLPVHNDQSTLAVTVQRTLEVLSDLNSQFELIVIDDGSSDATIEVADELAGYYPQITALRHAKPQGRAAAIRSGLRRSTGDIVLVHDGKGLKRIERGTAESIRPAGELTPHAHGPKTGSTGPQRPNYLAKLRDFSLGK